MQNQSEMRIVPGADTAVLFLHGISGTPRHFDKLLPLTDRVPSHWSYCNLLLPGHGGKVTDFSRSSMKQWKEAAGKAFRDLCETHGRVILVGHSMGSLFAAELAAESPAKVAGLFLLAVPLRPWMRLSGIGRLLRLTFGCLRVDNEWENALQLACGVEPTWKLWEYLGWIPRFLELFGEIYIARKVYRNMPLPGMAFQSGKDELVCRKSERILNMNPQLQIHILPESGHFYYAPEDRQTLLTSFENFLENIKKHD